MSNKIFGASGRAMFYPFSHIPTMRTEDSLFIFFGWPQFHHKNPHKLEKSSKPLFAGLCILCHPAQGADLPSNRVMSTYQRHYTAGRTYICWLKYENIFFDLKDSVFNLRHISDGI